MIRSKPKTARKRRKLTRMQRLRKTLDKQFSEMIRARDAELPCVSCGQWKPNKQAGHFMKREILATRWHPQNVHGECAGCNGFDPHHYIGYHKTLEECVGVGTTEKLATLAKIHWKPLPDQLERLILACGNPYDYESEWYAVQREFAPEQYAKAEKEE